uniref:ABC transporter domain-containing protein n=1 Tax=Emiliania huxleyi TaxID=2903 RepID=A0A7S3TIU4_EMIHU
MPSARDTASTLLAGLDEDVLDYLVTMLEGDEEQEAMEATVAEFLLSTEHVATEEEATAKCRELFAALSCAGAADAAETAAAPEPELKVLEQKTSIAESDSHLFRDVSKDELGGRLVDLDEALEVRRKRKARQEAELRAVRAAHSRVLAQRAAEDAALAAATTAAVELRAKQGAYTGAVEAKPFSLPNPGGGRDLLEKASFTLVRGRIYALIGRNGKGKSTLLRALASRLVGDIPPALTVHYVSQEVQLDEERLGWTPAQVVVHADVERRLLLAEAEELEALELAAAASDEQTGRLQEVRSRLELIEAHTAEERATSLLTNLGFSAELRARRMEALSGGWRVRTALAAAIFARPDLLLLDEPTNHLSIGAVLWLARELSTSPTWQQRMAVVVSHDRVFLDEVATDTLHVSGAARQLTQSRGNYSGWAKRRAQQQLTHEREMESKRRMIAELRAFKPLGSTPKQMKIFKSKEKMADKLEEEARELDEQAASLTEDAELPLSLKAGGEVSGFLVQVKGVSFGYPGSAAPLFSGVEMGIDARSRIVLLGENGNGKTTLVKLLLGDLAPTAGEVGRLPTSLRTTRAPHHSASLASPGGECGRRPHRPGQPAPRRPDRPHAHAAPVPDGPLPGRRLVRARAGAPLAPLRLRRHLRDDDAPLLGAERRAALACRPRRRLVRSAARPRPRRADKQPRPRIDRRAGGLRHRLQGRRGAGVSRPVFCLARRKRGLGGRGWAGEAGRVV